MTLRSDVLFDQGLDVFGEVVDRLGPEDWAKASPCAGWTALDVLGHLGSTLQFGVSVLRGEQPTWAKADPPGSSVEGDPAAYWAATATEARAALQGADLDRVMDTPMGPRTVADRLAFPAIDLYVHASDVARAAGGWVEIPAEVAEFAHQLIDPLPPDAVRGPSGAFGPEVDAPEHATPTEAFLAWTGRRLDPR